jgi:hypothetical protein
MSRSTSSFIGLTMSNRLLKVLMLAALAATALSAPVAEAQTYASPVPFYPWCALSWGKRTEHRNCGFVSFAQCMNYVRGGDGMCFENVWDGTRASATPWDVRGRRKY